LVLIGFVNVFESDSTISDSGNEVGTTILFGENVETSVGGGFSSAWNVAFDSKGIAFINKHGIVCCWFTFVDALPCDS
jgi:hypothetical protein